MRFKARFLGKAVIGVIAIAAMGWVVMSLWNAVIPAIFIGGRAIDYLHALGLLFLSRILFGGFRGHGGCHKRRFWRKWESMTPDERAQFQRGIRSGWRQDKEETE